MSSLPSAEEVPAITPDTPPTQKGDLTEGPILRTLVVFAIPMLLSNLIQTLNGSINAIWVGRLIGESALAAVANANVVVFLLFAAIIGFAMATSVRVGQHFGARRIDLARRSFGSGLGFCIALAVTSSALGAYFAGHLLDLLAIPDESSVEALAYLRVIFITLPFTAISMMVGMGLRSVGDARTPLYSMILMVLLDIVLNPLLILGPGPVPEMGITGSALASGIAGFGGLSLVVWRMYRHDLALRLRGPEWAYIRPGRDDIAYVAGKGLPMGAQMLLVSSAQVVMIGLVNREGLNTTAAYGASIQLWNYLQMPAFALSMAVTSMVAQAIGAGKHDRVHAVTRVGMMANLVMTGVLAALIVIFDKPLLALFLGGDSPAVPIAEHIQLIITWSFVIMGAMMVLSGTMRSYGVVLAPLAIQAVALYPIRLGFYFAGYPMIGAEALWWSFPVASVVSALMTWTLFARGRWRKTMHRAYAA